MESDKCAPSLEELLVTGSFGLVIQSADENGISVSPLICVEMELQREACVHISCCLNAVVISSRQLFPAL